MQAFMYPETARALLLRSNLLIEMLRACREIERRQVREFEAAFAQLLRLNWDEKGARELARVHVYGSL